VRSSQALAVGAFLVLVPGAIWIAYAGADAGLYPDAAVPFAFAGTVVAGLAVLAVVLPRLRAAEGETTPVAGEGEDGDERCT
jgi:hypothetical protein